MKKLSILILAFLLAGCGAISPAQPTATSAPPPTAQVIIATVLVTVVPTLAPTQPPPPTAVPTQPPQIIVVTATPQPGAAAPAPANPQPTENSGATATATLPSDAGGNLFSNFTRSGSFFDLRCLPQDITFGVSTANLAVVEVDMYYRIEDLTTQPITYSDWSNMGKMATDKHGNFTFDVNTTNNLSPDLRATSKGWFDYQFVGISKTGDAVGRSGKISQQVLYLKDCP